MKDRSEFYSLTHQQVARGELDELFERYQVRLRAMAEAACGEEVRRKVDVDDIVQETLLATVRGLDALKYDRPRAFYFWIRRILSNRIVDCSRAHTIPTTEIDTRAGSTDEPAELVTVTEEVESLRSALDALPECYRKIIRQRFLEGETLAAVARSQNSSISTVHKREKQALDKLRVALASWGREAMLRLPPENRSAHS